MHSRCSGRRAKILSASCIEEGEQGWFSFNPCSCLFWRERDTSITSKPEVKYNLTSSPSFDHVTLGCCLCNPWGVGQSNAVSIQIFFTVSVTDSSIHYSKMHTNRQLHCLTWALHLMSVVGVFCQIHCLLLMWGSEAAPAHKRKVLRVVYCKKSSQDCLRR